MVDKEDYFLCGNEWEVVFFILLVYVVFFGFYNVELKDVRKFDYVYYGVEILCDLFMFDYFVFLFS